MNMPTSLKRRKALRRAGLVGAGLLAGLAPAAARADQEVEDLHGIEGAWLITVTPLGGPASAAYQVLNLYTAGGGVAGDSAHDPTTGSGVYGAWARSGSREFQITFVGFTFSPGGKQWTGSLKVQAKASLTRDRGQISGPAKVSIYAPNGGLIVDVQTTFHGTRIQVEPL